MLKIQRNETCPCGSGMKYKKCCLAVPEKNEEIRHALSIAQSYDEIKQIVNKPINIYRLKVELIRMGFREMDTEVSRTLDIDGRHTLYDLHMNIQDLFGWDNDHMFSFYLGEKLFDRNTEYSANPLGEHIAPNFGQSSKPAADAQLRDLKLSSGFSFWYLFDYGDELVHKVTVEAICEMTPKESSFAKLVNKIGDAPSQYRYEE